MRGFLIVAILSVATGQPLFFKPQQQDKETWTESISALTDNEQIVCPGGQYRCRSGQTCCKSLDGEWKCCPLPAPVCCSDGRHCCPSGTTCDLSHGTCIPDNKQADLVISSVAKLKIVPCPGGRYYCSDGYTCCAQPYGGYGCCPLATNPVCCPDGLHCCPQGSTCDPTSRYCNKGSLQFEAALKVPALRYEDVVCPDGKSECPDSTTCCKLQSGDYGCCPLPCAVCCADGVHCCPSGYTCDVSAGKCKHGNKQIEWVVKEPARKLEIVPCGGRYYCPDGYKCCPIPTGGYGCCSASHPVCCSDGLHCCPLGTTCNVSSGTCHTGDRQVQWVRRSPAKLKHQKVWCPGGAYYCSDGYTCCPQPTGGYGCCPLVTYPVCCPDGLHCCPQGTTCDPTSRLCNNGDQQFEAALKVPALLYDKIICPDGQSECPDGTTCCKLDSGDYGCCPYSQAVCCADKLHCCPSGETCDLSEGTCKKELFQDWLVKNLAKQITKETSENLKKP